MGDPYLTVAQSMTTLYASITAMPAGNVMIAAPGANLCLKIDSVYACAMTATTNQEIGVGPTTTSLGLRTPCATKGFTYSQRFQPGWVLETNTSFGVWLATTGAIHVSVEYSVIKRGAI